MISSFCMSAARGWGTILVGFFFFFFTTRWELRPNKFAVCLCFGATGPLYAGYMLAGGYSWRLFFWVEFAFGVGLLIMAFFVVEETLYKRKSPAESIRESSDSQIGEEKASETIVETKASAVNGAIPPRKTFVQTLKFWGTYDKDSEFFMMIARSFTYFLVPHVFWVITTYGLFCSLFFAAEMQSSNRFQEFISALVRLHSTTSSPSR